MVALVDLLPASFRGVRFLVPRDNTSEGRNSIRHHYPDSAVSYVEDNGYTPPEFDLTVVLHGADLLSKFGALRNALNQPGPGTLNHPWYGAQNVSVIGPWKVTREDRDSGVLTLDVKFAVSSSAIFPANILGIAATVTGLAGNLLSYLFGLQFRSVWGSSSLTQTTLGVLSSELASIADAFVREFPSSATVAQNADAIASYGHDYVTDPDLMRASLSALFRAPFEDTASVPTNSLFLGYSEIIDTIESIAASGDRIDRTTYDLALRSDLIQVLTTHAHAAGIASLAEAASAQTYTDAGAVETAKSRILQVRSTLIDVPEMILSTDAVRLLDDTVNAAFAVIQKLELQLPRIVSLKIVDEPASLLSYGLYEDDSRVDTLIDLNPTQCPLIYDGEANVLSVT